MAKLIPCLHQMNDQGMCNSKWDEQQNMKQTNSYNKIQNLTKTEYHKIE